MKKFSYLLLFSFFSISLFAQHEVLDERIAPTIQPLELVQKATMPTLDNQSLLATEMQRRGPGIAPKFAENIEVEFTPDTHGTWEDLADGNSVWRMRIKSAGAKSLNLGFSKYLMPENGSLILYSPDHKRVMGPFTPADNEDHEQLWTPILDGDELVIEVAVPTNLKNDLQLELSYVNHDFIGFSSMASGSCNLDVICGIDDGWAIVDGYRDIIQSVAVIGFNGGTFCTGFLVNNARQDCTPFFMTADHCGVGSNNAASLVAYWNYFNSTCRQPGSPASGGNGDGSLADFNTGATFRAGYSPSDMTLVEFDDPISPTADAFFAGWSAAFEMPQDTIIAIHHPSTDEKRISFEFDPAQPGNGLNSTVVNINNATHVIIPDWDIGTTEGGSSGSPIFNNQKQVVGQLHGGAAACSNDAYDTYGWFHTSWEGGGTPSTRLKDWLDPDNLGITALGGRSQMACSFFVEGTPAAVEICSPDDAVFTISATESFVGNVTLSVSDLPVGVTATFAENPIAPGGSTTLTITNTPALATGTYTMMIEGTDGTNSNTNMLTLTTFAGVPEATNLVSPSFGETGISTSTMLQWTINTGETYTLEIAEDNAFTTNLQTVNDLTTGQYQVTGLNTQTDYYWRVKASNLCGEGDFPTPFLFTTANIACNSTPSADDLIFISDGAPNIYTSTIEINTPGQIDDINVSDLEIAHTYLGDLIISLTSPQNTTIILYNAANGCSEDNLLLGFDDESMNTNVQLLAMCESDLTGVYQPEDPLASFDNESAMGTWTLTVEDIFSDDGGVIFGWNLDICTVVADDFSVAASASTIESCLADEVSFEVTIGGAFEDTGVNLSADNLPIGAVATFSQNPAMPGSTVTVTLSGAAVAGGFSIQIIADDGSNTGEDGVIWNINDAPFATNLVNPPNGAMDQPLTITMNWEEVNDTDGYFYIIATDPDFNNVILEFNAVNNNLLQQNLEFGTTYYWMVVTENDCGESESEVFSFTTFPDLAVDVNPENQAVCVADEAVLTLNIGEGFSADGATITAEDVPGAATVAYSSNPASGGELVTVTIGNLVTVMPGIYTINFVVTDDNGTTNVSADLTVEAAPNLTELQAPMDGAQMIPVLNQTFTWDAVPAAIDYTFELSLNDDFTDIVESNTSANTSYTLANELDEQTVYFWRVIVNNNCGSSVSTFFNFTSDFVDGTFEVLGTELTLNPNPTRNLVHLALSAPLNQEMQVEVFAINGQRLQSHLLDGQTTQFQLDFSAYAGGVYLVKIVADKVTVVERVILEK